MLPFPIIPWPSKDEMQKNSNQYSILSDTGAGSDEIYAVRHHSDGTKTYLTKQEYEDLWQSQK